MVHNVLILLWKNLLMRKNHFILTSLEICLPIAMIVLANLVSTKNEIQVNRDPIFFDEFKSDKCDLRQSHYGNIVYEPSTPFIDLLMSEVACYAGYKKTYVKAGNLENSSFSIGVKFEGVNESQSIPNILNYTLYPTNKVWGNSFTLWRYSAVDLPKYSIPTLYRVIELQRGIDASFLRIKNIIAKKIEMLNTDFFSRSPNVYIIIIYFALFLAFTLMLPPIVSRITQEKATGSKELMLMMGIRKWQLWVSKFLDVMLFSGISVSGMVLFLYISLTEFSSTLSVSFFIVWSLLMYGLVGISLFLFFLSCFFSKATLAVYCSQAIWCSLFVINNIVSGLVEMPRILKYLTCLFPHLTLMNGMSLILQYNSLGKQIALSERLSGRSDALNLLEILLLMSFNVLIFTLLTWYMEEVKPGKFGVPKPYNFIFKKSFWKRSKLEKAHLIEDLQEKLPESFEVVPSNMKVGVAIQNVSKVYKTLGKGSVVAVDNVSINFYQSEISALLGHNGAGKTTVFSIITGMTYPTSGKVFINGYDLVKNTTSARSSLGLCPQQDMLFNDLTIQQTLTFYGVIKGLSFKNSKKETHHLIEKLKLQKVKNTQGSKLSGGQKRKVSLGIALIGGSKVLVLDEPTSGMDPEIRREIWELLLSLRGSKTVLLTTHFMEEADALCDRIAIMDHGEIKCYGSPMFLKSRYGKGYVLSLVAVDLDKAGEITRLVKSSIPNSNFKSQNIRTLNYELPEKEIESFPKLFYSLDKLQADEVISSYSMSLATLEDVFLRLKSDGDALKSMDYLDSPQYSKIDKKFLLYLYQFYALLVKKWILFLRSYKSFLIYSILPAAIVLLSAYLTLPKTPQSHCLKNCKSLTYSLDLYSPFLIFYSDHSFGRETSMQFENYARKFHSEVYKVPNITEAVYNIFKTDFYKYTKNVNLAVNFSRDEIQILHNEEAVHMVPVALNFIHNFFLKLANTSSKISTSVSLKFSNKDIYLAAPVTQISKLISLPDFSGVMSLFYILGPLKEVFYGAKEIQLMATPSVLYWLSSLFFDVFTFLIYMLIVTVSVGFIEKDDFMAAHWGEIVTSVLFWGAGLILIGYFISTFLRNTAAAFCVNLGIYILFTFVLFYFITFEGISKNFQYLHPSTIIKFGFMDLTEGTETYFILILFVYACVLFGLLILKDSQLLNLAFHRTFDRLLKINYSVEGNKDEFVKQEEYLVKGLINEDRSSAALIVNNLKRWFLKSSKPSPVVRGISFSVFPGECFGLLGVNGAGKTTTFRMLTGALPSSQGSIYINSTKLTCFKRTKYLFAIGYCSQNGGLLPMLKGKELLKFMCRLRGMRSAHANHEVTKWLERFDLQQFANHKCGNYSGGNQRKLSTAIALIGDCPLIFLDEPTSGVDPVSRRSIWKVIGEIQEEGQSIILTSHSMDECEALCSRLAIMVNGSFRCIGEITTLKDRFGKGYTLMFKLSMSSSEEDVKKLKKEIVSSFSPGCELIDEHMTILQYHITNKSISWTELFRKLIELKSKCGIVESFTASATTLEQIFIQFARNQ